MNARQNDAKMTGLIKRAQALKFDVSEYSARVERENPDAWVTLNRLNGAIKGMNDAIAEMELELSPEAFYRLYPELKEAA